MQIILHQNKKKLPHCGKTVSFKKNSLVSSFFIHLGRLHDFKNKEMPASDSDRLSLLDSWKVHLDATARQCLSLTHVRIITLFRMLSYIQSELSGAAAHRGLPLHTNPAAGSSSDAEQQRPHKTDRHPIT